MELPKQIKPCPTCGCQDGYFRRGTVSGRYRYFYTADGGQSDNTHLHDHIKYNEQKSCYCENCENKLPKSTLKY